MKLSDESRCKIEEFFRDHLGEREFCLPEVRFYAGRASQLLTRMLQVQGITFGRRVIIFPELLWRSESNRQRLDEEFVVHEIAHVLQYRRDGFVRFWIKYYGDYRKNLQKLGKKTSRAKLEAYLQIPYEIEARSIAAAFVDWSRKCRKNKGRGDPFSRLTSQN